MILERGGACASAAEAAPPRLHPRRPGESRDGAGEREGWRARERLELTRDIHERVIPQLARVALELRATDHAQRNDLAAHAGRISAALADLRRVLSEGPAPRRGAAERLEDTLARLQREHPHVPIDVRNAHGQATCDEQIEALVEHFLNESVTNAVNHARPTRLDIAIDVADGALQIEVTNGGATPPRGPAGIGLRLLSEHALRHGAVVTYGMRGPDRWQTRLVAPLEGGIE
jgi:two-component system sensor histidine kinase UhpB